MDDEEDGNMNTPVKFWDKRYAGNIGFEVLTTEKPSEAVEKLVAYLREQNIPLGGKLLDIGCGMGRNTHWFVQQGFDVTGVDISSVAIDEARRRAEKLDIPVQYQVADVSRGLSFPDESMDFIADIVMNQLLTSKELEAYTKEVVRVLRPGGKFLLYTLDRSIDKEAQELIVKHPGPEANTYIIPQIGLMERTFTLDEIINLWKPLKVEHSELLFVPTTFEGKVYERYFWWVILRKS